MEEQTLNDSTVLDFLLFHVASRCGMTVINNVLFGAKIGEILRVCPLFVSGVFFGKLA